MTNPTVEHIAKANTDALTKSGHAAEHIVKTSTDALTKGGHAAEHIVKTSTDALTKSGRAAEKIVKGNADALTDSGNASSAAFQELIKAYQELATKNAKNLTAAIQAFSAVKNPAEFIELQQRLIMDGVEAAVRDSQQIAELTAAVFNAAFEPVKKQMEAVQKTARN